MKKSILLVVSLLLFLTNCKKDKLESVSFNDNPYDNDYSGPNVFGIDSVTNATTATHIFPNRIWITIYTQMYQSVVVYRNGIILTTVNRSGYGDPPRECIQDYSAHSGTTYTYTALLKYDAGVTKLSDPVTIITP